MLNGGLRLARGATGASTRLLFSGPHGYEPLCIDFTAFTVESNSISIIKNSSSITQNQKSHMDLHMGPNDPSAPICRCTQEIVERYTHRESCIALSRVNLPIMAPTPLDLVLRRYA